MGKQEAPHHTHTRRKAFAARIKSKVAPTTAQTTVFRRTDSGFDRIWDRIVRAPECRANAAVNTPNASVYDARWSRVMAKHNTMHAQACL